MSFLVFILLSVVAAPIGLLICVIPLALAGVLCKWLLIGLGIWQEDEKDR